jgi:hypothetical protein
MPDVAVAQQQLNGAQIRPCFEKMGRKGMSEGMATHRFLDAGFPGCCSTDSKYAFRCDSRSFSSFVSAREQTSLRLHPAPVLS